MPKFSKSFPLPGVSAQSSYDKISKEISRWTESQAALLGKIDITHDAEKKEVKLASKWVNASLSCTDDAVRIDGDLSLFAMPFKSKVEEGIEKWVQKSFPKG